jgi:hypothetical protein
MTGAPSNYGMQRTAIIAALLPWRYRDAADAGRSADSSRSRSRYWVRRSRSLSNFRRVGRAEYFGRFDTVTVADAG